MQVKADRVEPERPEARNSKWNSLEVVKVFLGILTPLAILLIGFQVNSTEARERATIAERLKIYNEIGSDLNDIYCYIVQVGNWKELSPDSLISRKRRLDKTMYSHRPLFSAEVFRAYGAFIDSTFQTYNGIGEDALIRSDVDFRPAPPGVIDWTAETKGKMTGERGRCPIAKRTYADLMRAFTADFQLPAWKSAEAAPELKPACTGDA